MGNKSISGSMDIEVRYTLKKVKSHSIALKGEIQNDGILAFYELSVPINSFKSPDSLFDEHLQQACEINLFPVATGKGKIDKSIFNEERFTLPVDINFHGVRREYMMNFTDHGKKAIFSLDLDSHHLKRPSLFGIKINNEVKIQFQIDWSNWD